MKKLISFLFLNMYLDHEKISFKPCIELIKKIISDGDLENVKKAVKKYRYDLPYNYAGILYKHTILENQIDIFKFLLERDKYSNLKEIFSGDIVKNDEYFLCIFQDYEKKIDTMSNHEEIHILATSLCILESEKYIKLFLDNVRNEKILQYLFRIANMFSNICNESLRLLLNDYRINIFIFTTFNNSRIVSDEKRKYKNNDIRRKIKRIENIIQDDIKEKTIWINVLIFIKNKIRNVPFLSKNTIYRIQKYFNLCNFQIDRLTCNIQNWKKQLSLEKELNN